VEDNKRSDTAAGNYLITLKYTIMAKTLKQLSDQQERFNKLWKIASDIFNRVAIF
jgi:hypothetical protein